jgi:membrane-anchored glycerophosphoryl diester phosphodiesterase (GDPDase)
MGSKKESYVSLKLRVHLSKVVIKSPSVHTNLLYFSKKIRRSVMMDVKTGYKTTEFWLTLTLSVVAVLYAFDVIDENAREALIALITAMFSVLAYTYSRAYVKTHQ